MRYAYNDFVFNEERAKQGKPVKYAGQLQCFCQDQGVQGVASDVKYGFDD